MQSYRIRVISFVLQSDMKHSFGIFLGALFQHLCYGLPTGIWFLILQRKKSWLKQDIEIQLCEKFIEYVFIMSTQVLQHVHCTYVTPNNVKSENCPIVSKVILKLLQGPCFEDTCELSKSENCPIVSKRGSMVILKLFQGSCFEDTCELSIKAFWG